MHMNNEIFDTSATTCSRRLLFAQSKLTKIFVIRAFKVSHLYREHSHSKYLYEEKSQSIHYALTRPIYLMSVEDMFSLHLWINIWWESL